MSPKPKVVVGVDGSPSSAAALQWAAREAHARRTSLVAVMAWDLLDQHLPDGSPTFDPHFDDGKAAEQLEHFLGQTLAAGDMPTIERVVECAMPARILLDVAEDHDVLVVGSRGLGGFKGLLLGSVSEHVVTHAHGPVVVVPEDRPQRDGRIIVGVDGSASSVVALKWAVAEARMWGSNIEAVGAWSFPYASAMPFGAVPHPQTFEDNAQAALERAITQAGGDGSVTIERALIQGQPARVLREQASGASLLVVGSRGRGGFLGMLLGSVSSQSVHHAQCPTVVVHPSD